MILKQEKLISIYGPCDKSWPPESTDYSHTAHCPHTLQNCPHRCPPVSGTNYLETYFGIIQKYICNTWDKFIFFRSKRANSYLKTRKTRQHSPVVFATPSRPRSHPQPLLAPPPPVRESEPGFAPGLRKGGRRASAPHSRPPKTVTPGSGLNSHRCGRRPLPRCPRERRPSGQNGRARNKGIFGHSTFATYN